MRSRNGDYSATAPIGPQRSHARELLRLQVRTQSFEVEVDLRDRFRRKPSFMLPRHRSFEHAALIHDVLARPWGLRLHVYQEQQSAEQLTCLIALARLVKIPDL